MINALPCSGRRRFMRPPFKILAILLMFVLSANMAIFSQTTSCSTSASLITMNGATVSGSISDATLTSGVGACNGQSFAREGWYRFVATSTTAYVSVTTSNRNPMLYGFASCSSTPTWCANATTTTSGHSELMVMTGLTIGSTYYILVGNSTAANMTVTSLRVDSLPYCTAGATTSDELISNFKFGTINSSPGASLYQIFPTTTTSIAQGGSTTLTATVSPAYTGDQVLAWIDFNQDGDFTDAGENVYTSGTSGPYTGSVTIPINATVGTTRMRVRLHYTLEGQNATSCGTSTYGQVLDYPITITAAAACSGLPASGAAVSSVTSTCSGQAISLSATGLSTGSGITYQWQSSTDNVNFSNISGANSASFSTAAASGTTYYRISTTCSGQTSSSSSVSVVGATCGSLNMPLNGNVNVSCGTNTMIYDNGGPSQDYTASGSATTFYGTAVLQNSNTGVITISGTINTEPGYDFLTIYAGAGTGGTVLYNGSGVATIPTITSAPGQPLTVRFSSDELEVAPGFALSVTYTGTCAPCAGAPSAIIATVTSNSISASWTAPNPAPSGYQYAVTSSATPPASGTAIAETSVTINSLASNSDYYLHVRAVCDGPFYSPWTTYAFFTPCASITSLPSTEGFEGSAPCWTVMPITGSGNWGLFTTISGEVPTPHSGSQFAGIAWSSTLPTSSLLMSPPHDISANGNTQARVKFWIYRGTNGLASNRVTVRVHTAASTGGTLLFDIPRNISQAPVVASAGWYEYSANIPLSYNTGVFYITAQGAVGSSGTDWSIGLDDFRLEFNPPTITNLSQSIVCASGTDGDRTVIITGANFIGATSVDFNGLAAQSFTIDSATQITAVVSASSTTGTVTVTGPGGTATSEGTVSVYGDYQFYADADGDTYGTGSLVTICAVDAATAPAGYALNNTDCNDANNTVWQSTTLFIDVDGDGFDNGSESVCYGASVPAGYALATSGPDCNDANVSVWSSATFYVDVDGDGFDNGSEVVCFGATTPQGYAVETSGTDCDDTNAAIWHVGNFFVDADNDGYDNGTADVCYGATTPTGYSVTTMGTDCNDNNASAYQSGVLYVDADGDGYDSGTAVVCYGATIPAGFSATTLGEDCNDSDANVYQSGLLYVDADNDGYTSGETALVCFGATAPSGYALSNIGIDCNDSVAAINPGHAEVLYNGVDDNCDGNLDEGFQHTTQIQASQCGVTLSTISSLISAVSKNNSTAYRFEVTNTQTQAVQILERPLNWFSLTMLANYDYATTYSVRVEIQRNGIWLGYYGPSCLVSSPAILAPGGAAQVSASQCGITLATINTLIAVNSIPNTTTYRFRITNLTDQTAPNQVQTIDRPLQWFSLTMLSTYNYGTTYMIEVSVKTNGAFSGYGSPCTINTPAVPMLNGCGSVIAADNTLISTLNRPNVTSYRFEVTNMNTNNVVTIDRPINWFKFNMIPNYEPGGMYGVRISLMTSGSYSPFSDACEITGPGSARPELVKQELSQAFAAVAYPNPFADSFGIAVTTSAESAVNVKVYDMTGRLLESKDVEVSALETEQIGQRYPAGVYNIIVSQGENVKTLRVVKR